MTSRLVAIPLNYSCGGYWIARIYRDTHYVRTSGNQEVVSIHRVQKQGIQIIDESDLSGLIYGFPA